jgi:lysyl-tRNA synthetase class 2
MPSTVIRDFTYQPETKILEVTFVSGRRYRYREVPPNIYQEMQSAFAKGEYFNSHIRGRYNFDPATPDPN